MTVDTRAIMDILASAAAAISLIPAGVNYLFHPERVLKKRPTSSRLKVQVLGAIFMLLGLGLGLVSFSGLYLLFSKRL